MKKRFQQKIKSAKREEIQIKHPELKTLEWDILNPDRLINLEINNKRKSTIT